MKTSTIIPLFLICLFAKNAIADDKLSSQVIGWGMNDIGQATGVPSALGVTNAVNLNGRALTHCVAVAADHFHSLALQNDGTVIGWGWNSDGAATGTPSASWTNGIVRTNGQVLSNVAAISTCSLSLALLNNGKVVGWGGWEGDSIQQIPTGLSNVIAISAGKLHNLALISDGTVIGWPWTVPPGLSNIVAISASPDEWGDNVVLKADGTVVEWNGGIGSVRTPIGVSNIIAVAAGGRGGHGLALEKDGTVFDLRYNSPEATVHEGLSNVVAIAADGPQCMALTRDGRVAAWGVSFPYHITVPAGLSNIVAIAAGEDFCLAIQTNSALPITNSLLALPILSRQ